MNRRATQSIVANPVLVGAVTTLVVVVAVFLAYNANNGLPFVPTTQLNVQISNGANLVPGNEVREGGFRVGVVEDMQPVRLPSGTVGAELKLKLDKTVGQLPTDTTFVIRPRSALGLKYVELHKGSSSQKIPDGGTLPARQATVPVELDEFYNIFDKKTRDAARVNLRGFGDAFAGRGESLNVTIERLPRLFGHLRSVMSNLSDPRTDLQNFFKELGDAARIVAPIAGVQAHLFTTMAITFEAISADPQALRDTIAKSPSTLSVSTESLRVQRPFLNDVADFSKDLKFAARDLRASLPTINVALETGTPVLLRSVELNTNLQQAMAALRDLATAPTTNQALRALTGTVGTLQPQLRYLGPYATVCNYWNMFWTFNADHFTEEENTGGAERALLNDARNNQQDGIGSMNATEPADGIGAAPNTTLQFFHGQPYGAAINSDGTADCEAGQRGYLKRLASNARSIKDPAHPLLDVVTDPHTPGSQGPTYKRFLNGKDAGAGLNVDRVPAGETFTREPQTGPVKLAREPLP
jgi:virulence factor Mce-like protein